MGIWEDILRTLTTLNGCKNVFYNRFRVIPWMHHKIINGLIGCILGNLEGAKASGCIISCATPDRKVFDEKNDRNRSNPKTDVFGPVHGIPWDASWGHGKTY